MSSQNLFIRLYLDEDVSIVQADVLRARGYEIHTLRDAQQLGQSDAEQLAYAASRGMAIVTHNRADFEALAASYRDNAHMHAGIIIAVRRSVPELSRRLLLILDSDTADELRRGSLHLIIKKFTMQLNL